MMGRRDKHRPGSPPVDVRVYHGDVVYSLDETLRLTPDHQGSADDEVSVYTAYGPSHLRFDKMPKITVAVLPSRSGIRVPVVRDDDGLLRFAAESEEP